MANVITCARILCGIALLFFPALSPAFYALYALGGVTDMIDGTVARKTHKESAFGAGLDSAADLVFFAACLIKLLPVLEIPVYIYVWAGVIALIKIVNVVSGFVMHKKLTLPHTVMNKVTGTLAFALPLTVTFVDPKYISPVVCAAATFAAVQEGHYIRTGKETERKKEER